MTMVGLRRSRNGHYALGRVLGVLCLFTGTASTFTHAVVKGPSKGASSRPPATWMSVEQETERPSLTDNNSASPVEEYRNIATRVLSNFMRKEEMQESSDPLADIDFSSPKMSMLPLETLAQLLDAELYELEWFVTGRVNPCYFAESFKFQDPDVKLSGIEAYARGVQKIFNQETARAEIISTTVSTDAPNMITCTWRLSGNVNIGPGLTIKPYIVYTDFTVDPHTGLIVFQQDRFDSPQWDILLSSLFPWTIGKITAPPAPPVEPRVVTKPVLQVSPRTNPFDPFFRTFGNLLKK